MNRHSSSVYLLEDAPIVDKVSGLGRPHATKVKHAC